MQRENFGGGNLKSSPKETEKEFKIGADSSHFLGGGYCAVVNQRPTWATNGKNKQGVFRDRGGTQRWG